MKAAVCLEPGEIEIQEVPKPVPEVGQVLVEVRVCGVCRSDVSGYLGKHPMITYPIILGHECSGVVVDAGPGVKSDLLGARVAVETFFRLCGRCRGCKTGFYNLCQSPEIIGHNVAGAFAEYVLANADFVFSLPEGVTFEQGALVEPLSVAVHAIKRCHVGFDDIVAIIGAGAIGLLLVQIAKTVGAQVLIIDISEEKLALARHFGADELINATRLEPVAAVRDLTKDEGADVVIEAAGTPETLRLMVEMGRAGGTLMPIGFSGKPLDEINLGRITLNEMSLLGILGFCHDFPSSLDLLALGRVDIQKLITHRFPLSQVEQAILAMKEGRELVLRALVAPEASSLKLNTSGSTIL